MLLTVFHFLQLPSYVVLGTGAGLALYMVKYTLTGLAIMIGPARDKLAAAAIEVDLSSIPEGPHHYFYTF